MFEEENAQWGLVIALLLDGKGGARNLARAELDDLKVQPGESLWLHWDRSHPETQTWLRQASGLSEFTCDLLLGQVRAYHMDESLYDKGRIDVDRLRPVARLAGNDYAMIGNRFTLERPR